MKPEGPWNHRADGLREALDMEAFSLMYGWTPSQIRAMDDLDRLRYKAIMRGRGEAQRDQNKT